MARIVSKAFELRLKYQMKQGRKVPLVEVAEKTGIDRRALTRLEQGETERIDSKILQKLCAFYGVGVGDILEYVEDDQQKNGRPHGQLALQA